jgi:diguanylate cyclase
VRIRGLCIAFAEPNSSAEATAAKYPFIGNIFLEIDDSARSPHDGAKSCIMSPTLIFILGGCLTGAVQLAAGIGIGMWIRRRGSPAAGPAKHDLLQAELIAKRLQDLAVEMSSSVGEHRSKLDQASQLLTSGTNTSEEQLADLVVDVIGNVVRANQNLKTKLETAECRLQEQAVEIEAHMSRSLTDALTGLPNRREFNARLEERMGAWNRRRDVFSLLLLDVDHFKKLNDRYGHLAGDQVLATIGRALRGAIRREDAVARFGGEEFAVLLPSTSLEQAILAAQKVREAVARVSINRGGQQIAVTVSGGLATIESNERIEGLIQRADSALYAAKGAGRNCTFLHNGIDCRLAEGSQNEVAGSSSSAARLVELINSPDAHKPLAVELPDEQAVDFGSFLERDNISAELAHTCDELRRFLEERAPLQVVPVMPAAQ